MFCLDWRVRRVRQSTVRRLEQMAEQGIEPVIDFVSAEGKETETTHPLLL